MEPPETLADGFLELRERLGEGAQGAVYAAWDRQLDRKVAVKLTPADRASPRVHAEAELLSRLDHPHLVKVREVGTEHGFHWLSMDFLPGGTLQQRVARDGGLPPDEGLRIVLEVLLGLCHLHARGVVHRDVKPANVFFAADGRAVLGDLGVARMPDGAVSWRTASGVHLGSLDYAAPEQEIDARSVGPAADLYSVGALTAFALSGRRPSFLFAPDDAKELLGSLPPEVVPLVVRACDYDPRRRFFSARELLSATARARDLLRPGEPAEQESWLARLEALTPPTRWQRVGRWLGLA